jgi:Ca2+-binding RTX toxin-like protein
MRTSQRLERPAAALGIVIVASLIATPSLAGPGDRIDRAFRLTGTPLGYGDYEPQLAMDEAGNFVAVWWSRSGDIDFNGDFVGEKPLIFRRFAANGTPLGAEVTVDTAPYVWNMGDPGIAMAGDGSFVVTWTVSSYGVTRVAARYAANDAPLGGAVIDDDDWSGAAAVATAADGSFVVVWIDGGINARLFDAAGDPQGPPFPVSPFETGVSDATQPQVAMSGAGDFVVIWSTEDEAGIDAVRGRVFDPNGVPGDTFTVATGSFSPWNPPNVAMSSTGQFVVVYSRIDQSTGGTGVVYGRRFDAAGGPLGGEFRVSAAPGGGLAIDSNARGDFAVSWREGGGYLHTRLYRASGSPATSDQRYLIASGHGGTSVAIDGVGNFVAAFPVDTGLGPDYPAPWVYAQRFAGYNDTRPACMRYIATRVGNNSANVLNGGPGHDVIYAGGGNDTIHGWSGDDVICGGSGADVIYGGSGNDDLVGGPGDDLLDGDRGRDFCNGEGHTNADTAVSCEATPNVP